MSTTTGSDEGNQTSADHIMWLLVSALQAAANALAITDVKGSILWVNQAFCTLTGYSEEESIGNNLRLLKSWEYDQSFYKRLWSTILAGQVWHGEIRNRKKNGTIYTEEMTITPLRSGSGEVTHFVAIKQDITEKKKLESQYRHAQKMEAVGRLAGGVAHDFNNILSVINGYTELCLENRANAEKTATYLEKIKVAVSSAASMTKQLLAFSRQAIFFPKIINLNDVVTNLLDMLRTMVGDDVVIVPKLANALGAIEADVGQIEQIIMNLIVNAVDAMPQGGEILIETGDLDLDEAYQRNHEPVRPGAYTMLSISDSGCGMDETTKAQIFEPFFTTKPGGNGMGLGLSTVYGIVKQSGGYIWVYTEPNNGTTFKIFFPKVNKAPERVPKQVQKAVPRTGAGTILVVEDNEVLREMLVRMLRSSGYTVLESDSAKAATELIGKCGGRVQLLLTDVVMPETSGLDLVESLRPSFPDLKVVFMSGHAAEMLSRRNLLPRKAILVQKPFSKDTLLATIHSALHGDDAAVGIVSGV